MKDVIHKHINKANSLSEVRNALIKALEEIKNTREITHIGYVSGIVSSDGIEYIKRNIQVLGQYTEKLKNIHKFPMFSAADVLSEEIFLKIDGANLPTQVWFDFWRNILETGYITDIFMTPGWEASLGAKDEYETAQKLGISIVILKE